MIALTLVSKDDFPGRPSPFISAKVYLDHLIIFFALNLLEQVGCRDCDEQQRTTECEDRARTLAEFSIYSVVQLYTTKAYQEKRLSRTV